MIFWLVHVCHWGTSLVKSCRWVYNLDIKCQFP